MPKCLVCAATLPPGQDYCPPKQMEQGWWFSGCYSIRFEMIWSAVRRMHHKSKTNMGVI